jgi:cytochrome b561
MRHFSPSLRLWHWLQAIAMLGIFVTVILRTTVMHKEQIGGIVQTRLAELGTVISDEQAVMIGKAVRAPMWDWHIYLGIALSVLLVWRLAMVVKNGFGFDENPAMRHVYRLYKLAYLVMGSTLLSGLVLYWKLAGEAQGAIEGVHEWLGWGVLAFSVLHVAGVILAEKKDQSGLVSRMIHGKGA